MAKTIGPGPLAATGIRCIEHSPGIKRIGGPSAKQDLETVRFCVFASPGLHLALTSFQSQLRNPG